MMRLTSRPAILPASLVAWRCESLKYAGTVMTASLTLSPRYSSASRLSFCRIIAEISGGVYVLPPISTTASPLGPAWTWYGTMVISSATSPYLRPMKRLIENTVFSGLVTAWRLATLPTRRSPLFENATTDGVVRPPSLLGMTVGSPPSSTAIALLVVPRSMPITLPMKLPPCRVALVGSIKVESETVNFMPRPGRAETLRSRSRTNVAGGRRCGRQGVRGAGFRPPAPNLSAEVMPRHGHATREQSRQDLRPPLGTAGGAARPAHCRVVHLGRDRAGHLHLPGGRSRRLGAQPPGARARARAREPLRGRLRGLRRLRRRLGARGGAGVAAGRAAAAQPHDRPAGHGRPSWHHDHAPAAPVRPRWPLHRRAGSAQGVADGDRRPRALVHLQRGQRRRHRGPPDHVPHHHHRDLDLHAARREAHRALRRGALPHAQRERRRGVRPAGKDGGGRLRQGAGTACLLYTSDAADDLLCVDLGG